MNGLNLLFVDDDAVFVDEVVARLKNESVIISWIVDSRDLMGRIGYLSPDIVIVNADMAGMNPMAAVESIRAQYPLMKVLVLFEPQRAEKTILRLRRGPADYLKKPVGIDDVVGKLKTLIKKIRKAGRKINIGETVNQSAVRH